MTAFVPIMTAPPNGVNGIGPLADGASFTRNGITLTTASADQPWSHRVLPQNILLTEVRTGDFWAADGTTSNRAEVFNQTALAFETVYWSAFSVHISVTNYSAAQGFVFYQYHATKDAGDVNTFPNFNLSWRPSNTGLYVQSSYSAEDPLVNPATTTTHVSALAMADKTWHNFVCKLKFSTSATGSLDVWMDGNSIASVASLNMGYVDAAGPYFKFGHYRPAASYDCLIKHANFEHGTTDLTARIAAPLNIVE